MDPIYTLRSRIHFFSLSSDQSHNPFGHDIIEIESVIESVAKTFRIHLFVSSCMSALYFLILRLAYFSLRSELMAGSLTPQKVGEIPD